MAADREVQRALVFAINKEFPLGSDIWRRCLEAIGENPDKYLRMWRRIRGR